MTGGWAQGDKVLIMRADKIQQRQDKGNCPIRCHFTDTLAIVKIKKKKNLDRMTNEETKKGG